MDSTDGRRVSANGSSLSAPAAAWITAVRSNARARLRLLCFPYAGGSGSAFQEWPRHLPAEIEVCAVQLPGRQSRFNETPFVRLSSLVEALTPVLASYCDTPVALFGHSMGALVGFEVARALRRRGGCRLLHLFVSSYRAPHLPNPDPPIHALPDTQFIDELRRLSGTPEAVLEHAELMQLLLPALRADFAATETYVHEVEPPLSCGITAFGGASDPRVSQDELLAWREQTHGRFSLTMFAGGHFSVLSGPPGAVPGDIQRSADVAGCFWVVTPSK